MISTSVGGRSLQMQPVLKIQTQNALFDERNSSDVVPNLQVVHIYCEKAPWHCIWAYLETERQFKEHTRQGHKVRPIRFIGMKEANHFVSLVINFYVSVTYLTDLVSGTLG
jgi:hypothetical protein